MNFSFRVQIRRPSGFVLDVDATGQGRGLGIVGPSGSGKSTLLDAIAGLERAESVQIDGDELAGVPVHRRRFGYVTQDPLLFPHLSVDQNLRFGSRATGSSAIVEALGIGALLPRMPRHLSGGERRRVALARALASRPRVLLLDEPFAGLDEARRREAMSLLVHVGRRFEIPIVFVSHAPEEVVGLTDRTLRLENGRVAGTGTGLSMLRPGETHLDNYFQGTVVGPDRVRVEGVVMQTALPRDAADEVRLAAYANDLTLAHGRPRGLSTRNVIATRVAAVTEVGGTSIVELARPRLLASVTRGSATALRLRRGAAVTLLVKSTAIAHLGPAT